MKPKKGSDLLLQGFTSVVQFTQKFNVICVSKYSLDDRYADFHFPADGGGKPSLRSQAVPEAVEIEVKQVLYSRDDFTFSQMVVTYQGSDYVLEGFRNGLSGSALVIGIYNADHPNYDIWHLYTDTPSAKPDRPNEVVTSEELRRRAKEAMGWNSNQTPDPLRYAVGGPFDGDVAWAAECTSK